MLGDPIDLKNSKETFKASTLMMSIAVAYSSNSTVAPEVYNLKIGATQYPIKFSRVELMSNPVYMGFPYKGETFQKQIFQNNVVSFVFTITKLKKGLDTLHDMLHNEFFNTGSTMLSASR